LEAASDGGAQGLSLTTPTIARPATLHDPAARESGGLSGRPLAPRSRDVLRIVSGLNKGRLALISCGGIETGEDILARIRMGADMVQIYSSFVLQGPGILTRMKTELLDAMRRDGFETIADAHGIDRPN
ncbi:MAG: dihydroorotate dehydrogenase (quinone), partial [Gluconobacter oxydans]